MTHNRIKNWYRWSAIVRAVCGIAVVVLVGASASYALGHDSPASGLRFGLDLAQAEAAPAAVVGTVDAVAANQQAGRDRYIAQCSTCHLPVPPAVLPRETWTTLMTDTAHYGVALELLPRFDQQLVLNYLRTYSRENWGSRIPAFRVADSAYFTALHPDITSDQPVRLSSCVACHDQADAGNFRRWQVPLSD